MISAPLIHGLAREDNLKLYYHIHSLQSQKVLIAFYEKGVAFTPEVVNLANPAIREAYTKLNPWGEIPTLLDDKGNLYRDSSTIIEYLEIESHSIIRLIPADPQKALFARHFDRALSMYLYHPLEQLILEARRVGQRNEKSMNSAEATLEKTYATLDKEVATKVWLSGEEFSIADCAAAPALIRLCTLYPFEKYTHLWSYLDRLQARPSVSRIRTEAEVQTPALLVRTSWSRPTRRQDMATHI